MQLQLRHHPAYLPRAVEDVFVDLQTSGSDLLDLWFVVQGRLPEIVVPVETEPRRADNLWRTTCFELFVRGAGESYQEWNFSPSSQWAVYNFKQYRKGMIDARVEVAPITSTTITPFGTLETHVTLSMPDGVRDRLIGLSAIIEELDGTKSYWALAHPPEGQPDFHHPDCFVARLP